MLVGFEDRCVGLEDAEVVEQQVAEVGSVELEQAVLIGLINLAQPALAQPLRDVVQRHLCRGPAPVLPAADRRQHGAWAVRLWVDIGIDHQRFEQPQLVVVVEDGEVLVETVDAERAGVDAQDAGREAVKGAQPPARGRLADQRLDPVAHFTGSLVGKSHGEQLLRPRRAGDQQVTDPGGQGAGLARAGAREHQHRSGEGLHRLALGRVQPLQVSGAGWCSWRSGYSRRSGRSGRRQAVLHQGAGQILGHGTNVEHHRHLRQ